MKIRNRRKIEREIQAAEDRIDALYLKACQSGLVPKKHSDKKAKGLGKRK